VIDQPDFWGGRTPLELRYREWRDSVEGQELAGAIAYTALDQVAAGAKRISVNLLFEQFRRARHVKANNSYRAFIARELREKYPQMKGLIEVRERKSERAA